MCVCPFFTEKVILESIFFGNLLIQLQYVLWLRMFGYKETIKMSHVNILKNIIF